MSQRKHKIGIMDSGIGGVTIYNEIRKLLGNCQFFYCSDSLNFPYGTKTESQVISAALAAAQLFVERYDLEILIVACNTASTVALDALRKKFDIPIVGVVPAIKPAAERSKSKVIGLLATPGTIGRTYTKELIAKFAPGFEVISLGSSELVQIAEDQIAGKPVVLSHLEKILSPILQHPLYKDLDQLVLGCTHFPILNQELSQLLHSGVNLVDSGPAIANRVMTIIEDTEITVETIEDDVQDMVCKMYFTKLSQKEIKQAQHLKVFHMYLDR